MNFKSVTVVSYKAFAGTACLPLTPLTVVFGNNGSGKSALVRAPIAVSMALAPTSDSSPGLPYDLPSLSLGRNLFDLRHGVETPHFNLLVEFEKCSIRSLHVTISKSPTSNYSNPQQWIRDWTISTINNGEHKIRWDPPNSRYVDKDGSTLDVEFRGLVPFQEDGKVWHIAEPLNQSLEVRRIAPSREGTIPGFSWPTSRQLFVGHDGSYSSDVLGTLYANDDHAILDEIKKTVAETLAVEIEVDEISFKTQTFHVVRGRRAGREETVPISALGTGVAHALPVIIQNTLLSQLDTKTPRPAILLTEEPEAHLHPASQASLADSFISTALAGTTKCVVETHSECFVLRIRRRIAEGTLAPEDVRFVWIDDETAQTEARILEVSDDGSISGWPEGWFDSAGHEVRAIYNALRDR